MAFLHDNIMATVPCSVSLKFAADFNRHRSRTWWAFMSYPRGLSPPARIDWWSGGDKPHHCIRLSWCNHPL